MKKRYIPEQGDIVYLDFNPQASREQKGRRPALIISKSPFNKKVGLVFVCPITNTKRSYPTHVALPAGKKVKGFVVAEQMKSLDYGKRKIDFVEKADLDALDDVLAIIDAIIF